MRRMVLLSFTMFLTQQPQNPSPMVDHPRAHTRLPEQTPPGRREKLDVGTLYMPAGLAWRLTRRAVATGHLFQDPGLGNKSRANFE